MSVEIIADSAQLRLKIICRYNEGSTIRQLSRQYGISRNRVRRILRTAEHRRQNPQPNSLPQPRKRASRLDAFMPAIKEIVEKYPTITAVRVLEELRCVGYQGGITMLREKLKQVRPMHRTVDTVRFETDPGVQGQMDWSPYTIHFTKTGKTTVLCFSYILGYSRRHYIDFTLDRVFHTLIRRHCDAFSYFQGVPLQCLYDNEKTVVLRREAGQPVFNPRFIDFITHYRCKPIACLPRHPAVKGKVERPFQYVDGNLLNGRTFIDFEDLRQTARWWLRERSDTHLHDTTHRPPRELFEEAERSHLQPLPLQPYDCSEIVFRVCPNDAFIEFETNRYSVPFGHTGEIIALKATEEELFIYNPYLDLIAHHQRIAKGSCRQIESTHHRSGADMRYGLEPIRQPFEALGDTAGEYLVGLQKNHHRSAGYHARCILQLKEHYLSDDINRALMHALRYYAFDAASIERILKAQARPRTLESLRNEKARATLAQTIPAIKQRNLCEYATMLNEGVVNENPTGCDQQNQEPLLDTQPVDTQQTD